MTGTRNPSRKYFKRNQPYFYKSADNWEEWDTDESYDRTFFIGIDDTNPADIDVALYMIWGGKPVAAVGSKVLDTVSEVVDTAKLLETEIQSILKEVQELSAKVAQSAIDIEQAITEMNALVDRCEGILDGAEAARDLAKDWANKMDGTVDGTEYSAKYYANEAKNSETAAAGSATTASASATTATEQATAAATSANQAATSASTAASYASSAHIDASGAANSAQAAQDSATNAANSATNAANSETNSANSASASATSASNSHIWAEGTDEQVQALGGVHSSKVWAEQSTNANISLTNSPYTTNRILEIPQDIKLELNNGTLTLKAGSKVYVPNGVGVFEVKTAQQDFTMMRNTNAKELVFVRWSGDNITSLDAWTFCYSGSSAPSSEPFMAWYDTSNNVVKGTANGGSTWTETLSFSIAAISEDSTKITSIDQVFNGFGYIGSTVFALPGVKVQIPYGKNQDGTFHHGSEGYISKKVLTLTRTSIALSNWSVWSDAWGGEIQNLYYVRAFKTVKTLPTSDNSYTKIFNEEDGYYYYTGSETKPVKSSVGGFLVASNVSCDANGKVTSFSPYTTVDSVANSNASNFSQAGRSYLSGLGMPSNRYIDLTLGASGSTYTAPANGWFGIQCEVTGNNRFFSTRCIDSECGFVIPVFTNGGNIPVRTATPCLKGDRYTVLYNVTINSTPIFRFIYAQGED